MRYVIETKHRKTEGDVIAKYNTADQQYYTDLMHTVDAILENPPQQWSKFSTDAELLKHLSESITTPETLESILAVALRLHKSMRTH